jgi:lipoprotein-releasing system permease protein
MKAEYFIAKRLAFSKDKSFTKVIIRIAIAAIAMSITVMILTNAMISGFKKEIHSKMFGFWGHIHITDAGITKSFDAGPIAKSDTFVQKIRDIKIIEYRDETKNLFGKEIQGKFTNKTTKGGVNRVQSFVLMPGLLEKGNEFQTIVFKGVDDDFDWKGMERFLLAGHQIEGELGENDLVVSKYLANKLNLSVNQAVIVSFIENRSKIRRRLNVAGVYNTGLEEFDKRFIFGNADKLRPILNWDSTLVAGFEVFLDDIDDSEVINDYVYSEVLPNELYSERIQQKFASIFEWLKLQDINETIIIQLMNVVAIINMMTVLLILILERTKMIGTLKAIGATNWFIQKIFVFNAAFIIFFGVLIGNLVGLSLAFLQKHFKFIKLDEANYYLDTAPINVEWSSVVFINILVFVVVLIFLILPTFFINKIKPVQALRFD